MTLRSSLRYGGLLLALLGIALVGAAYAMSDTDAETPLSADTTSGLEQIVLEDESGEAPSSTVWDEGEREPVSPATTSPELSSTEPSSGAAETPTTLLPSSSATGGGVSGEEPTPDPSGQPVVPTSGTITERFSQLARQFPYALLFLDDPEWQLTSLEAGKDRQGSHLIVSTYAHIGGTYFISLNQQNGAQAQQLPSGEIIQARGTQVQTASMGENQFLAGWVEGGSTILLFTALPQERLVPLIEGLSKTG